MVRIILYPSSVSFRTLLTIILAAIPDSLVLGSELSFAEFLLSFFTYLSEKNLTVSHQLLPFSFGVTQLVVFDVLGLILEIKSLLDTSVEEFRNIVQVVLTSEDRWVLN